MLKLLLVLGLVHEGFAEVGTWNVFSTTTAYDWAYNSADPETDAEYKETVDGDVCKAVQVNMLVRHGARYPLKEETQRIELLRQRLLLQTEGPKYQDIKNWTSEFTLSQAGLLVPIGEQEQVNIGRRTGRRFKSLFTNKAAYLKFLSSTKQRNLDSSAKFYTGLNDSVRGVGGFSNEVNASLLRYFEGCKNFKEDLADTESNNYDNTAEFVNVKQNLQERLGLPLSTDDVYLINELCAYDKFTYEKDSFWCDLLNDYERRVIEYGEDIKNYHKVSSGNPVIPEMACPLVSNIFTTMDKAISDKWDYENLPSEAAQKGYMAGVFMNSHKTVLLSVMAALGLYEDEQPVLASNKASMADRKFKTSQISPFSSNIGFVLYSCQHNQGDIKRTFRLQVMVNEKPVQLPACDSILCPYEQVRAAYAHLVDRCNYKQTCEKPLPKLDTFSTTTAYSWANKVNEPAKDEEYDLSSGGEVCKAVHVSMLVRHGARYPYVDETGVMNGLLDKLRALPDGPKYQDIVDWGTRYDMTKAENLVSAGAEEQFNVGRRTGLRFKSLLQNKGQYIKYLSSTEERNIQSSKKFYDGLSDVVSNIGSFRNNVNASLLRYHDDCKTLESIANKEECRKYHSTSEFKNLQDKLQSSLGLQSVSQDEMFIVYKLCAYDRFIQNEVSFWCDLMTDEDREVLEYGQDIKNYYTSSSGNPVVPDITCPLMGDIFHTMDIITTGAWDFEHLPDDALDKGYLAGKFMDSHAPVLISVMTALGLFKNDGRLLGDNKDGSRNRSFRTSTIAPFSANVGFALYTCQPSDGVKRNAFKVKLMVNEKPVQIPGCNSMLCPYAAVRQNYKTLIDSCNVKNICEKPLPRLDVFSITTPYNWSNKISEPKADASYEKIVDNKVCTAVHLNMLVRHGARYPFVEDIRRMETLRQKLTALGDGPGHKAVVNWGSRYTVEGAERLSPQGAAEQYQIGRRIGLRFNSLLRNKGQYVKYVSSTKERNEHSMANFYAGLNSSVEDIGAFQTQINGSLLRYFENCPNFEGMLHKEECRKYSTRPEFMDVQTKLKTRLGIDDLMPGDVYLVYELCAYDLFIYGNTSFWCDLLDDEDRQVLEYGRDIQHYYQRSAGHPRIPELACPVLADVFQTLDKAISYHWDYENLPDTALSRGYLAGKFMNSHATVLLSVMTALGLFKGDQPLRADNRLIMEDRKFRTSIVSPFSANIAMVLYSCHTKEYLAQRTFMLELLVNEKPVEIPACGSTMCPYDEVRMRYVGLIDRCNINDICNKPISAGSSSVNASVLFSVVIFIVACFNSVR